MLIFWSYLFVELIPNLVKLIDSLLVEKLLVSVFNSTVTVHDDRHEKFEHYEIHDEEVAIKEKNACVVRTAALGLEVVIYVIWICRRFNAEIGDGSACKATLGDSSPIIPRCNYKEHQESVQKRFKVEAIVESILLLDLAKEHDPKDGIHEHDKKKETCNVTQRPQTDNKCLKDLPKTL